MPDTAYNLLKLSREYHYQCNYDLTNYKTKIILENGLRKLKKDVPRIKQCL